MFQAQKSYQVTLGSIISLQGGVCNIAANFVSPPPAFESLPNECLSVSLTTDYSHPGLPLGKLVTSFIGVALGPQAVIRSSKLSLTFPDALDVNVQNLVPQQVQDTVNSITIDEVRAVLGLAGAIELIAAGNDCVLEHRHRWLENEVR